ncbi:hypothetical protein PoB_002200100 [Plakobranchus ocellatus]|uniref:Uncharacterized protein n=1 Tax=Plakobranchus ocellatus TaxID=259542 RepID=A0AAV3Z866_9GAST|nr:hypothetical protein PoB_002200100 [Plakobranchus ocellatus]
MTYLQPCGRGKSCLLLMDLSPRDSGLNLDPKVMMIPLLTDKEQAKLLIKSWSDTCQKGRFDVSNNTLKLSITIIITRLDEIISDFFAHDGPVDLSAKKTTAQ